MPKDTGKEGQAVCDTRKKRARLSRRKALKHVISQSKQKACNAKGSRGGLRRWRQANLILMRKGNVQLLVGEGNWYKRSEKKTLCKNR